MELWLETRVVPSSWRGRQARRRSQVRLLPSLAIRGCSLVLLYEGLGLCWESVEEVEVAERGEGEEAVIARWVEYEGWSRCRGWH